MAGYSHKTWACPFFHWDERLCVRCEGGCMSFPDREALAEYADPLLRQPPGLEKLHGGQPTC